MKLCKLIHQTIFQNLDLLGNKDLLGKAYYSCSDLKKIHPNISDLEQTECLFLLLFCFSIIFINTLKF